jgi:hypothetical protein
VGHFPEPFSNSVAVAPVPIERSDVELRPDPARVIVRPFLPNEQILPDDGLLARILVRIA